MYDYRSYLLAVRVGEISRIPTTRKLNSPVNGHTQMPTIRNSQHRTQCAVISIVVLHTRLQLRRHVFTIDDPSSRNSLPNSI